MTDRNPGRFWFPPHPPARVLLMYTRATSLPNLYIRNIIPDDMDIPLLLGYRALSGWGYTDFHANMNFAFWAFSEVRFKRILGS
jgi:hypothetical protein